MRLLLFETYAFGVQRPWHSPNILPTMVYGQAFRIITWQPPSLGLSPVNLYKYTNGQEAKKDDQHELHHKPTVNPGARERSAVPAYYTTATVLPIW